LSNAGLLGVPFGGAAHLGFAAGAQIGDGFGELFGVRIKLLDDGGLADSTSDNSFF
jgi:hypothetical protein